jgi:hypothetical protein
VTPSEPPILSGNELFELLVSQQANGIFPERIDGFIIHGFKRKSTVSTRVVTRIDSSIAKSIFRRHRTTSDTVKLFSEFNDSVQFELLQVLGLNFNEETLLLSFIQPKHWLLLTNERLIWQSDQDIQSLLYGEIETVSVDRSHVLSQGFKYKTEGTCIEVKLRSGDRFTIDIGVSGGDRLAWLDTIGWILQTKQSVS